MDKKDYEFVCVLKLSIGLLDGRTGYAKQLKNTVRIIENLYGEEISYKNIPVKFEAQQND